VSIDTHQMKEHHITTDDLAFSAYLKMKGHRLIKCDHQRSKTIFTFSVNGDGAGPKSGEGLMDGERPKNGRELKVEFINSPFLQYYNELRNLKKII
jgi:hypothetical protein